MELQLMLTGPWSLGTIRGALERTFPVCQVDHPEGMRLAREQAHWIRTRDPRIFLGKHDEWLAFADRLERAGLDDVGVITFGDAGTSLRLVVVPQGTLLLGVEDGDVKGRSLAEAAAVALGAELEAI